MVVRNWFYHIISNRYIPSLCNKHKFDIIYIMPVYRKSEVKYLRNISILFWFHSSFESTTQKWSTSIWCQLLRLKVESIKKTCHHVSVKENISEIGHFFSILVTDNVNLNIFSFLNLFQLIYFISTYCNSIWLIDLFMYDWNFS